MEPSGDTVLFFAYGANLHFDTLSQNDVKVLSRDGAIVRDPKTALVFKHQGGQATLQQLRQGERPKYPPYGGQRVHGVLYRLKSADLKKLAAREDGYLMQQMEVELYSGEIAKAQVFVSSPCSLLPKEVAPPESYLRLLRDGAADQLMSPLYQAWLSSIETVTGTGLGPEYFDTPSRQVSRAVGLAVFLAAAAAALLHS